MQVDRQRAQPNDQAEQIEGVEKETATDQYQPTHLPLENAGLDQHAAEEDRQAELQAERDVHNERIGDASR